MSDAPTIVTPDFGPMQRSLESLAVVLSAIAETGEQRVDRLQPIIDIRLHLTKALGGTCFEELSLAAPLADEQPVLAKPSERYVALLTALAANGNFEGGQIKVEFVSHWPVLRWRDGDEGLAEISFPETISQVAA